MLLNTSYHGGCLAPFYDASLFPQTGGYIDGRLCMTQDLLPGNPTCCLPCPTTYWTYHDSFNTYNTISAWLNVAAFILLMFLLTSYFFLPVQTTRSHYLSISLIVAIFLINLGFIVPLGVNPDQCYNGITPNDMHSSLTCAWSGAFIISGGLCGAVWIFVRALSMHLQICWDIVPGRKFFLFSQAFGWGVPAAIFTATMTVTGVSFRFGSSCHVNHEQSMESFWGWLLGIAAASVILQIVTFIYCARVFISTLWSEEHSTQTSGNTLPRYAASIRNQTAKAIWRRLKSVLYLQWRGMLIVTATLFDVIFFAVVFVYLDNLENSLLSNYDRAEPWLLCLTTTGGDKNKCVALSEKWLVKENVVGAVLIMLSLIGVQVFCILFRWSLISGWKEYFAKKVSHKQEFVSLDALSPQARPTSNAAQRYGADGVAFEMQKHTDYNYPIDAKVISPATTSVLNSPAESTSNWSSGFGGTNTFEAGYSDYFDRGISPSQQSLHPPLPPIKETQPRRSISNSSQAKRSFSSTRIPSNATVRSMGWDPTSSYAASSVASPAMRSTQPDDRGFSPGQAL